MMFGASSGLKTTYYTNTFKDGSKSFMNSSGVALTLTDMDPQLNMTNYETSLAWGAMGIRF